MIDNAPAGLCGRRLISERIQPPGSADGRHHLSQACTAPHIVTFRGVITIFDRGHSQQATIDEARVNMKRTAAVRRS